VKRCLGFVLAIAGATPLHADYSDLINYFLSIRDSSIFPVQGLDADQIESAFGPRTQASTDLYDFHRGIDVDSDGAASGIRPIVAPVAGTFYDRRTTSSGGNIIILEHALPATYTYGGKNVTKFFTWYLHLDDNNITADTQNWTAGHAVSQGTVLGYMGDTGAPAAGGDYAVHLHWELRIGTNSSIEYQLANPESTQWGFDPHWNPMLLLPETPYNQSLNAVAPLIFGEDFTLAYSIDNDETPVLNRFEVAIVDRNTDAVLDSHTLDYNQRTGFDPTSTATLDSRDMTVPYVDPQLYGDNAIAFTTHLVVPGEWTQGLDPAQYRLAITAYDLEGNPVSLNVLAVPEPAFQAAILGLLAAVYSLRCGTRRRIERS
jgi:hypothetical protein